jgi:hypothetical protein
VQGIEITRNGGTLYVQQSYDAAGDTFMVVKRHGDIAGLHLSADQARRIGEWLVERYGLTGWTPTVGETVRILPGAEEAAGLRRYATSPATAARRLHSLLPPLRARVDEVGRHGKERGSVGKLGIHAHWGSTARSRQHHPRHRRGDETARRGGSRWAKGTGRRASRVCSGRACSSAPSGCFGCRIR